MNVDALLEELKTSPTYSGQIVHVRQFPSRDARFAETGTPLPLPLTRMLQARRIDRLYCHQAQTVDTFRAGANPLVVTGTASGKSLCYLLPLLELLYDDPTATILMLFPTKALSQDQHQGLLRALDSAGISGVLTGVIDGDTPTATRRKLRDKGRVIITNPDMLHAGIMPQHARWQSFLSHLKIVVVDELHTYSGIMGTSMANVFKRLTRLLVHYGSHPQIVTCSATIGNPLELATELMGQDFQLIDDDGSPRGRKTFVFWNPPRIRETRTRARRSANVEAHELMTTLVHRGIRTITFVKAKMVAEMILRYVSESLMSLAPQLASKVAAYRGGYLAEDRRELERRLFTGELVGITTTRALELGIDVGGLDACILVGYPGTLAGFFQQAGRAGRGSQDSLTILVGLDTAVNQYVMQHPDYIFGRPMDRAVIEPANPIVVMGHLRCAAYELPLTDAEAEMFGPAANTALRILEENRKLTRVDGRWYHSASEIPQHEVPLRAYSDSNVSIQDVDTGEVLGSLDKHEAKPIIHPEAIYIHKGDTYRVQELDLPRRLCFVKKVNVDYYTQPIGGTDVHHIDHLLRRKSFGEGEACWGEVTAHFNMSMYEKIRFYELDAISTHAVDVPHHQLDTMAFWLVPPESVMKAALSAGLDHMSGLKGIGYATRMVLPLFLTCDTLDFSHSVATIINSDWQAVFIYERYPLGLGFTEKAYNLLHLVMPAVLEVVRQCPCEDGCPCCVGKPLRGELVWNVERGEASIPSKAATIFILEGLLGDMSNLQNSDELALLDTTEDATLRMERVMKRRLERSREPWVNHPIDPQPQLGIPKPESTDMINVADAQRRGERKRDFNKQLRDRIAKSGKDEIIVDKQELTHKNNATTEKLKRLDESGTGRDSHVSSPGHINLGDSLAARARKLKKENSD